MAKKYVDRRSPFTGSPTLNLAKEVMKQLQFEFHHAKLSYEEAYVEALHLMPWLPKLSHQLTGIPWKGMDGLKGRLEMTDRRLARRDSIGKQVAYRIMAKKIVALRKPVTDDEMLAYAAQVNRNNIVVPMLIYLFALYEPTDLKKTTIIGYKIGLSERGFHRKHQIAYAVRGRFLIGDQYQFLIEVRGCTSKELKGIESNIKSKFRERGRLLHGQEYFDIPLFEATAAIKEALDEAHKSYDILPTDKWEPKKHKLRVVK
jgi:hypothetical protein